MAEAQQGELINNYYNVHYVFSTVTGEDLTRSAEITDHFVENNFAVHDHMAIKPMEFTATGFVGEKTFKQELAFTDKLAGGLDKLTPIAAFIPNVSNYVQTVINAASYIESSFNRYKNMFNNGKKILKKTKTAKIDEQEMAFYMLKEMQETRQFVTLYIPKIGKFENLLISNIKMSQNESIYKSSLSVDLKEYRPVETRTEPLTKDGIALYNSRCNQQKVETENLGKVQGKKDNRTISAFLVDKYSR